MKKITRIFSVFIAVFLFTTAVVLTGSTQKASAVAAAPGLTQFKITGFANKAFYDKNNERCLPKEYANNIAIVGPEVYLSYIKVGYGNVRYSIDGGSYQNAIRTVKDTPYSQWNKYGQYAVYAWSNVDAIRLTPGQHTIQATCFNTGVGGSNISDSITVTVK